MPLPLKLPPNIGFPLKSESTQPLIHYRWLVLLTSQCPNETMGRMFFNPRLRSPSRVVCKFHCLQDFLVVFGFQFPFHQGGDGFFGRNFAIE
jgi:hypothetical protein